MKVINDTENLVYDSGHLMCRIIFNTAVGQDYAFVSFMDVGFDHCRLKKPIRKRYWGPWDHDDPEGSLKLIMDWGGKWDELTKQK
ncbi:MULTISPECIES: hypothetical protein [unclassified Oleiphilus]|uniref:hypothetical protein n=1 Tax=unclassified Oleiphilus TaxID=2631174 RepID=UPI0007C30CDF|nr:MULTISPECIES: hypothetical protein [unclassified Oleiphilus]KZY32536.1 hypothetical protein A3729_07720 [Oleiphilus sp. HI0043]KZZ67587.1 hypothetical protein A3763_15845 [Oleiphilus sp. HI0128]